MIWWILGVFLLLAVLQTVFVSLSAGQNVPYSEFKRLLREGRVATAVVGEERIRGTMKADDGTTKPFATVKVDDPDLVKELNAANIRYDGEVPAKWMTELLGWLPLLLLLVLFWTFVFRRMGGAEGGVMSFAKSKAKIYAEDDVKVTFGDVAGVDEAAEELREIVEFLRNPKK